MFVAFLIRLLFGGSVPLPLLGSGLVGIDKVRVCVVVVASVDILPLPCGSDGRRGLCGASWRHGGEKIGRRGCVGLYWCRM